MRPSISRTPWVMATARLLLVLTAVSTASAGETLLADGNVIVYTTKDNRFPDKTLNGLPESGHYTVKVRTASNPAWVTALTLQTESKALAGSTEANYKGYFNRLANFTHSYANLEVDFTKVDFVDVQIESKPGYTIDEAVVRPSKLVGKGVDKIPGNGSIVTPDFKVAFRITKNCLFNVDINGGMEKQNTGLNATGERDVIDPVHAISIFVNPKLENKPLPNSTKKIISNKIFYKTPNGKMPTADQNSEYDMVCFHPGVHELWKEAAQWNGDTYSGIPNVPGQVYAGKKYYIPGDAVVYGTLATENADGVRIFGHGTISGERLTSPRYIWPGDRKNDKVYNGIELNNAVNTKVTGVTLVDTAQHSVGLKGAYNPDPAQEGLVEWTKIVTWRVNGDGIFPGHNGRIDNCFIRTQDDATYVMSRGITNTTIWTDVNGRAYVLGALYTCNPDGTAKKNGPMDGGKQLVVDNCDVIYQRSFFWAWDNSGFKESPDNPADSDQDMKNDDTTIQTKFRGPSVVFSNIRFEDPRPTQRVFNIATTKEKKFRIPKDAKQNAGQEYTLTSKVNGFVRGITFENITITSDGIRSEGGRPVKNRLVGWSDGKVENITFYGCKIAGRELSRSDFEEDGWVSGGNDAPATFNPSK